jgi:hypothetical protein
MKNEEWLDREIRTFVGALLHSAGKQGPGIDPGIAPLALAADGPPDEQAVGAPALPVRRPARRGRKPIKQAPH